MYVTTETSRNASCRKLREYENDSNAIIFAIPRGGVIIAYVCEQLRL